MDLTNSTAFRRSLAFARSRTRNGVFDWPTTTFTLKRSEDGRALGQLQMQSRKASYVSANTNESFSLKKNFWGNRWLYDGDDEREFGCSGFGWNFKPSFTFADGSRYYLSTTRRWPFGNKSGTATLSASFSRDNMEVMLLQNFTPTGFFFNEMTAPLEGMIATHITDERIIAGLLLFYQGRVEARHRSH